MSLQSGQLAGPRGDTKFIYASLYMDQMESYEFAETQIEACIQRAGGSGTRHDQMVLGVDIVATPEQIGAGAAHGMGRYILQYVDEEYPDLKIRVVGITDDDERRPIRDGVLTQTLTLDDIDDVHLFTLE